MGATRAALLTTGAILLVSSAMLPVLLLMSDGGDWQGFVGAMVFLFVVSPVLFVTGIVLMIVGLVRGGGQQQQQQVVVLSASDARRQGIVQDRRCTQCGAEVPPNARFCIACGRPLA